MKLITEITKEKSKILIVSKKNYSFISLLKSYLKQYQTDIFFSSKISTKINENLTHFDYCIFINEKIKYEFLDSIKAKRIILIYFNQQTQIEQLLKKIASKENIKVIDIHGDSIVKNDIDRILWFSFSLTKENYLKINLPTAKKSIDFFMHKKFLDRIKFNFSLKILLILLFLFFFLAHIIFIPPLIASFFFIYQATNYFKMENLEIAYLSVKKANSFLKISKNTYKIVRPTYLLLSLSLFPDNLIDIAERTNEFVINSLELSNNFKIAQQLFLKKNKIEKERILLMHIIKKIRDQMNDLYEDIKIVNQKIPSQIKYFQKTKNELTKLEDGILKLKKISDYFDIIFTDQKEFNYVIFFANNRELRPGGGFLGSFGILNIKDLVFNDIRIYDVYDADGQLKFHVDPPYAIRKYLHQPHWYLRDSNFSPDFYENYIKAKFFLEKEMGFTKFDGALLLTTTSIEQILEAYGNLYIPDFKEYINSQNFYLKAQIYAEKNFFPGSIQKKSFLSSVARQLIINLENVSLIKLANALKKSLDDKQIVIFFEESKIQELFDLWNWSGRLINPKCNNQFESCIADYFFQYDANLGVNKANFFVNRSYVFKTKFDQLGNIYHVLSIYYKNDSPSEVFPGGVYRNFFQILLPKNVQVKSITKDGVLVEDFIEEEINQFKNIGFFFEVLPKKISEIKISYQLLNNLNEGKQIYQIITQKQIGAANSDLILEFSFSKNIFLVNQNFSPLVKDESIVYNTILNTDKIFFLELEIK